MKPFSPRQSDAVKRMYNSNEDFMEIINYLRTELDDIKDFLLLVNNDEFKRLQGTGAFLDKFIKDIESASIRTDS